MARWRGGHSGPRGRNTAQIVLFSFDLIYVPGASYPIDYQSRKSELATGGVQPVTCSTTNTLIVEM